MSLGQRDANRLEALAELIDGEGVRVVDVESVEGIHHTILTLQLLAERFDYHIDLRALREVDATVRRSRSAQQLGFRLKVHAAPRTDAMAPRELDGDASAIREVGERPVAKRDCMHANLCMHKSNLLNTLHTHINCPRP